MKTQIRGKVFETNSSSSHSVTVDRNEVVDIALDKAVLRAGEINVVLDHGGYQWEWMRYRRPTSKIAYMLMQLSGGRLPDEVEQLAADDDHAEIFRENTRCRYLLETIERATGCIVFVTRDLEKTDYWFGIDHQSVGNGVEELEDEEAILRLIFGSGSYIETGNDNSAPPEFIGNDLGQKEHYFAHLLVDAPGGGEPFSYREVPVEDGWGRSVEITTADGAVLTTPEVNWKFREKVRDLLCESDVIITGLSVAMPWDDGLGPERFEQVAREAAFSSRVDLLSRAQSLRLVKDLPVSTSRKPYSGQRAVGSSSLMEWDCTYQAEVVTHFKAHDDLVAKLRDLFARAADYPPHDIGLAP